MPENITPKPSLINRYATRRNIIIAMIVALILTCICGVFTGISISPAEIQRTVIAVTQIDITEIVGGPTYTPYPSQTPYPTYTPQSALEPEQILVTATYPPDFTELYVFEGTGKSTTDLFSLSSGTVRISWEYTGTGNFALYLQRLDNDASELIENAIGNTTGQSIMNVGESNKYLIDINMADGDWIITIEYMP